jgi:hypothetical protein
VRRESRLWRMMGALAREPRTEELSAQSPPWSGNDVAKLAERCRAPVRLPSWGKCRLARRQRGAAGWKADRGTKAREACCMGVVELQTPRQRALPTGQAPGGIVVAARQRRSTAGKVRLQAPSERSLAAEWIVAGAVVAAAKLLLVGAWRALPLPSAGGRRLPCWAVDC